jgi:hypothetical protein
MAFKTTLMVLGRNLNHLAHAKHSFEKCEENIGVKNFSRVNSGFFYFFLPPSLQANLRGKIFTSD